MVDEEFEGLHVAVANGVVQQRRAEITGLACVDVIAFFDQFFEGIGIFADEIDGDLVQIDIVADQTGLFECLFFLCKYRVLLCCFVKRHSNSFLL